MKISPDIYEKMLKAARKFKEENPNFTPQMYAERKIGIDHAQRFRWDMFWNLKGVLPKQPTNWLDGFNDSHIDTVLRKIVKEIY